LCALDGVCRQMKTRWPFGAASAIDEKDPTRSHQRVDVCPVRRFADQAVADEDPLSLFDGHDRSLPRVTISSLLAAGFLRVT
jgi:hypothetical protein